MYRWARWILHPRLSLYNYRRKHHGIKQDEGKEKRLDKHNLHPRYPHVSDFLVSQQSLVVCQYVRFA